ncbi:ABC transporter ATP-binding protein [Ensifer sp. ENS06]|uniref:ABC transporter ATP-binding protein n=1 Tax=Ensifer sp. ENS06 TaxID=2769276 RepID=UPI00178058C4|nr:ABC transporter ATP-binding protein [Ensifer sp. ENS06]MBD9628196.1 ABC transporter ATP-binding protein [Ensifer sp. ENS06]
MRTLLDVEDLHSYYGKSHILQGVSLSIGEGEVVTLLGRNGAGKSTTLKSIAGLVSPERGSVQLAGRDLAGQSAFRIAQAGVSLVPENRGIFSLLSVEENLRIAERKGSPWSLKDIYAVFPRLEERKRNGGGQLSGGEQQMLSIARALLTGPKLLMLDEPVEGLAPVIVEEIVDQVRKIAAAGIAILLVEQNLAVCTALANRHHIIELGRIVYQATARDFIADGKARDKYLGVKAQ